MESVTQNDRAKNDTVLKMDFYVKGVFPSGEICSFLMQPQRTKRGPHMHIFLRLLLEEFTRSTQNTGVNGESRACAAPSPYSTPAAENGGILFYQMGIGL